MASFYWWSIKLSKKSEIEDLDLVINAISCDYIISYEFIPTSFIFFYSSK